MSERRTWSWRRWFPSSVVIAIAVGSVLALPQHGHRTPDAKAAGVAVIAGHTLYLVNGRRAALGTDRRPGQIAVVPAGFLYSAFPSQGPAGLRLVEPPAGAGYEDLGQLADDSYTVTADGGTAVFSTGSSGGPLSMVAVDLADGHRLTNTTMTNPDVVDVAGDWVLLRDSGAPVGTGPVDIRPDGIQPAEVWNIRTGSVTRLPDSDVSYFAVLPDGTVLRAEGVNAYGFSGPSGSACYDIVPLAEIASAVATGPAYCGHTGMIKVVPSPDGTRLLVVTQTDVVFVRTADLTVGRWSPVESRIGGVSDALFWDSPTSVVSLDTDDYERCSITGACHDLHLAPNDIVGPTLGTSA